MKSFFQACQMVTEPLATKYVQGDLKGLRHVGTRRRSDAPYLDMRVRHRAMWCISSKMGSEDSYGRRQ